MRIPLFFLICFYLCNSVLASEHGESEKPALPTRDSVPIGDCSVTYTTYHNPKNREQDCSVSTATGEDSTCCGVVAYNGCSAYPKFPLWKKSARTEKYDSQCFLKSK